MGRFIVAADVAWFPLVLTAGHYLNASLLKNGTRSLASL